MNITRLLARFSLRTLAVVSMAASFAHLPARGAESTSVDTRSAQPAASLPSRGDILADMERANAYFMARWPDPGCKDCLPRERPDNIWTRAVYYEGALALHGINRDPAIEAYATGWAEFHDWGFRKGDGSANPDDQCAAQAYIELYQLDPAKTERLTRVRANVENWTRSPKVGFCSWIDALQMTMPVFAKLGVLDQNQDYLAKMHAMYLHTKSDLGLYNPVDRLWWRDTKFKPPHTTPNGKPCYWSRGNGWVVAALVRTLQVLPPDDPRREEYLGVLRDMLAALLPLQREDGFWNVSLADPDDFGGPESTGTSLFIFGMAWAINQGHLPADVYQPAVARAWRALTHSALHPDGFLGYVQGTGDRPSSGQPVSYDSKPDFEDYGLGCFLLAGSEVFALARSDSPAPARPPSVSVAEHGAVGDGRTVNTAAIQRTIDALASSGGGTVVIPPGVFVSGALFFQPGVHLHLEKDAVLRAVSTDVATHFPARRTRIEGHFEESFTPALINADHCDGFRLTGEGVLDGDGRPIWDAFWDLRKSAPDPKNFRNLSVPRARLALIENSQDVLVEGVTFKDSQFWNLHLYRNRDVTVRQVRFLVPDDYKQAPSTDAIDVDSCQQVAIDSCFFSVTDDCIAMKGSKGPFALDDTDSPPVSQVRITNCIFRRGHAAVTIGSEATIVRDVVVERCQVLGAMAVLNFKLRLDTPQHYENIHYRDITLDSSGGSLVSIKPWSQFTDLQGRPPPQSTVRDITLSRFTGRYGAFGEIKGKSGQIEVGDILLEDFHLTLATPRLKVSAAPAPVFHAVMVNDRAYPPALND